MTETKVRILGLMINLPGKDDGGQEKAWLNLEGIGRVYLSDDFTGEEIDLNELKRGKNVEVEHKDPLTISNILTIRTKSGVAVRQKTKPVEE